MKNFTVFAISEASPNFFKGIASTILLVSKSFVISVCINPGATAFTRMLREATSFAKDFVKPITPALAAE